MSHLQRWPRGTVNNGSVSKVVRHRLEQRVHDGTRFDEVDEQVIRSACGQRGKREGLVQASHPVCMRAEGEEREGLGSPFGLQSEVEGQSDCDRINNVEA